MKKKINWFSLNRSLHRDLGFLTAGLTIIYAISGIAVNHIDDWNPNYRQEKSQVTLKVGLPIEAEEFPKAILKQLGETRTPLSSYPASPTEYKINLEGQDILVDTNQKVIHITKTHERFLLRDMNFIHLNHGKKLWSFVADGYAFILLFLAISGLFMVKGKKSALKRGKWWVLAGILIPLFFLILYKY